MLSVADIEAAALATWPALDSVPDGTWLARFSAGFTGRLNSIWTLSPDDEDAAGRLARFSELYQIRHLPAVFRVTPLTGRGVLDALAAQGWQGYKQSLVLSCPIGATQGFDGAARLMDPTDPAFLEAQAHLNGFSGRELETFSDILGRITAPACGVVIASDDGSPGASLLCVESGGIVMIYDVVTASALRGRGFGRRMVATALSWAAENGAGHAALQVRADNAAAISLYLSLGFTYRYPYHYCRRPETETQ